MNISMDDAKEIWDAHSLCSVNCSVILEKYRILFINFQGLDVVISRNGLNRCTKFSVGSLLAKILQKRNNSKIESENDDTWIKINSEVQKFLPFLEFSFCGLRSNLMMFSWMCVPLRIWTTMMSRLMTQKHFFQNFLAYSFQLYEVDENINKLR